MDDKLTIVDILDFNGKKYRLINRKANEGELIQSLVYITDDYPIDSILKVERRMKRLNEVIVCPIWYEEGMKCWGTKAMLEHDDYLVLEEIK